MKSTHYALEVVEICCWILDNRPKWKIDTVRQDDSMRISNAGKIIIDAKIPEVQNYLKLIRKGTKT